ncbi:MAG TPA: CrcB family protein [bacterium]|nr:CrcB family protein [bacterium]
MLTKIMWLGIAGGAGTLSRYALAGLVHRFADGVFPWGTLAVNATGCFVGGLFWAISEYHIQISGELRTIILIGFFGAFTTFSSFMLETAELARAAEPFAAMKNVILHNFVGAACLAAGILAVRSMKGG